MGLFIGLLLFALFCEVIIRVLKGVEDSIMALIPNEGNNGQSDTGPSDPGKVRTGPENPRKNRTIEIKEEFGIIYSDGSVEEDDN